MPNCSYVTENGEVSGFCPRRQGFPSVYGGAFHTIRMGTYKIGIAHGEATYWSQKELGVY